MVVVLGNGAVSMARILRHCRPWVHRSRRSCIRKHTGGWAVSVVCGLISGEIELSGQGPAVVSVAPPSRRVTYFRSAPLTLAYKARHTRKRLSGGGGDDDGSEWDEGGFGGSGGWDGGDYGKGGGNEYWGSHWSNEGWWWEEVSDAAFNLMYQVACWISLIQCLHFAVGKAIENGVIN